jgi:hypothetical protein
MEVLFAFMIDGSILECTECEDCYVVIKRTGIAHKCCCNEFDLEIDQEQREFIESLLFIVSVIMAVAPAA